MGRKSVCGECNQVFGSVGSFDRHRVGGYGDAIYKSNKIVGYTKHTRRCMTIEEMIADGMRQNIYGHWVGEELSDEDKEKMKKLHDKS